jgi:uncharacterized membrane protein affecting hemolysin expression
MPAVIALLENTISLRTVWRQTNARRKAEAIEKLNRLLAREESQEGGA